MKNTSKKAFTLVELLVVVVVLSVLSATVAIAVSRGSLEQRTSVTIQSLQEVRSSILLFRAGAVIEGNAPFPTIAELSEGGLLPGGRVPVNPFNGSSACVEQADPDQGGLRALIGTSAGWVYHASNGEPPVALFYANSTEPTDRTNPETGVAVTANEL